MKTNAFSVLLLPERQKVMKTSAFQYVGSLWLGLDFEDLAALTETWKINENQWFSNTFPS